MNNPFETIEERLNNIETILLEIKHNPKHSSQIDSDQWFDLKELCEYMPDKPSKATIYSYVHNGSIPFKKGLKKLRFLKSEIDNWLKNEKKDYLSGPEISSESYLKIKKASHEKSKF